MHSKIKIEKISDQVYLKLLGLDHNKIHTLDL